MKDIMVIKPNELIAAEYDVSVEFQRFINYTLAKIIASEGRSRVVELTIDELCEFIGFEEDLDDPFEVIRNYTKEVLTITATDGGWSYLTWISAIEYIPEKKKVIVTLTDDLLEYLINGVGTTRYNISNIRGLKLSGSIRLYEKLKQYEQLGKRQIKIDDLRILLSVEGKYDRPYNLEIYVLNKNVEEINNMTDIKTDYTEIMEGKSVWGYEFSINSQESQNSDETEKSDLSE